MNRGHISFILAASFFIFSESARSDDLSFSNFAELKSGSESYGEMLGLLEVCEQENGRGSSISSDLTQRFRKALELTGANFEQMNSLDSIMMETAARIRGSRDWIDTAIRETNIQGALYECNRNDVCCVVFNGFPGIVDDGEKRIQFGDTVSDGAISFIRNWSMFSYLR